VAAHARASKRSRAARPRCFAPRRTPGAAEAGTRLAAGRPTGHARPRRAWRLEAGGRAVKLTISPSCRVVPELLMSISMGSAAPCFSRYSSSATMSSVTAGTSCGGGPAGGRVVRRGGRAARLGSGRRRARCGGAQRAARGKTIWDVACVRAAHWRGRITSSSPGSPAFPGTRCAGRTAATADPGEVVCAGPRGRDGRRRARSAHGRRLAARCCCCRCCRSAGLPARTACPLPFGRPCCCSWFCRLSSVLRRKSVANTSQHRRVPPPKRGLAPLQGRWVILASQ
jgi:hypothetical protein